MLELEITKEAQGQHLSKLKDCIKRKNQVIELKEFF